MYGISVVSEGQGWWYLSSMLQYLLSMREKYKEWNIIKGEGSKGC